MHPVFIVVSLTVILAYIKILLWQLTGFSEHIRELVVENQNLYRVIKNDCRGFNNLPYTIHLTQEYVVAPMDQEILRVFFYDVRCAVVMHFSAWSAVY